MVRPWRFLAGEASREPVAAEHLVGQRAVRERVRPVPIQTGENWWFAHGMANAIAAGASDLAMVDTIRSAALPLAAKRMPGTVIAVIGVDTLQNAEFKLPEEVRKPIFDGVKNDFKAAVRTMFDGQLPEQGGPELKEWVQTKAEGQDPKMALALMRDLFDFDTGKLLKDAKVPVRCINSAGGYKSFIPTVVETNKKYADFGAVTIDGVGHYPMLEKPDEFNRKLRDVLEELRQEVSPPCPARGRGEEPRARRIANAAKKEGESK